jgi:CRP-like cAMP-binding protein/di/tricarboxylate transporter
VTASDGTVGARGAETALERELGRLVPSLGRVQLARLAAHLDPVSVATGEEVFRQGDPGTDLYLVLEGALDAVVASEDRATEMRVGRFGAGDVFGEMALFTDAARSATVRAVAPARLVRLPRDRFLELARREPSVALIVATRLSERLQSANQARLLSERAAAAGAERELARLPADRRRAVLEASVLDEPTPEALRALFGAGAAQVADDLTAVGAGSGGVTPTVLRVLRDAAARDAPGGEGARAAEAIARLAAASAWDAALAVAARQPDRAALAALLARALRAVPPLPPEHAGRWIARLVDDDVLHDAELTLARAEWLDRGGDRPRAIALLRRALGAALVGQDPAAGQRLSAEVARLAGAAAGAAARAGGAFRAHEARAPRGWSWRAIVCVAGSLILAGAAAAAGAPTERFLLLLLAAIALMAGRLVPDFAAGLGLVAGWVVLGLATPAQALAGFATKEWLFVLAVYGLAAAAAGSGVLFRIGLFLVRRLPHGAFWQAATLCATGFALSPLVPSSTARTSLTEPLAVAIADALRLPARGRAASLLGLAAWLGAAPLMFVFLNGSGTCLLAWGLLPEATRVRFSWGAWLIGAGPLGLFVAAAGLVSLFLLLRPEPVAALSRERVEIQVAVLGPPRARELGTIVVLGLTVAGWILAPTLGLDLAVVALLGLLGTIAIGSFDGRAFQGLDWNVIVFFGVVLSIGRLAVTHGMDRAAAGALARLVGDLPLGPLVFVLATALLSIVARLVLEQELCVLLAALTLLPLAARVGVDPWVVMMAVLATSVAWFFPAQTQSFLVALSASEGRLFSLADAQRFALVYTLVVLAGLALSTGYWRLLGLL